MNRPLIVPIILAGGKGTRLWPMSRAERPKQFLSLHNDLSLFQNTLLRVADPKRYHAPIIVTNADYRFLVAEQAGECGVNLAAIVLEPVARNTLAAITAGCLIAGRTNGAQLLHILPSDHEIVPGQAYERALDIATDAAQNERLVTFGIVPSRPATEYGYIEAGKAAPYGARTVTRFTEKPDANEASEMIATRRYYWNSGMFLFACNNFLDECRTYAGDTYAAVKSSVDNARADADFVRLEETSFRCAPNISIDYAVFEKTKRACVVPSAFAWSDLGTWNAVWHVGEQDAAGTVQRGPTSVHDTNASLVISEKMHIVVEGLDDVAVIASEDVVYIGRLSQAQRVGDVVKKLRGVPKTAALTEQHLTSYRPWGGFSTVETGKRFQVKRLFVKPGKRMSLQKHNHRSEHWVVVRGTAEVQLGVQVNVLRENESIYIPLGVTHRVGNPGREMLELIEVQTGSYLGEDDIVRLEDDFGRS